MPSVGEGTWTHISMCGRELLTLGNRYCVLEPLLLRSVQILGRITNNTYMQEHIYAQSTQQSTLVANLPNSTWSKHDLYVADDTYIDMDGLYQISLDNCMDQNTREITDWMCG